MADEVIWDKPCPVPEDLIKYVDDNVLVSTAHSVATLLPVNADGGSDAAWDFDQR